jgi:SAM-dependent methyltransferase
MLLTFGAVAAGAVAVAAVLAVQCCCDRKRVFAMLWRGLHASARERVAPLRAAAFAAPRRPLGPVVLELGPGLGDGLDELAAAAAGGAGGIRMLYLCEPNHYFHAALSKAAANAVAPSGGSFVLLPRGGEALPEVPPASVDAVVSHLVLCSVARPADVLAEVRRVLKPGGVFVFVEHVAAPATAPAAVRWTQAAIAWSGVWTAAGDGCRVDRDTAAAVRAAGPWAAVETHAVDVPGVVPGLQPHAWGMAVRE